MSERVNRNQNANTERLQFFSCHFFLMPNKAKNYREPKKKGVCQHQKKQYGNEVVRVILYKNRSECLRIRNKRICQIHQKETPVRSNVNKLVETRGLEILEESLKHKVDVGTNNNMLIFLACVTPLLQCISSLFGVQSVIRLRLDQST